MRVKIEEIQEPGLTRSEPLKPEVLAETLADAGGYSMASSTQLTVTFKKVSGRVFLKGSFVASLTGPCKRCTTDVPLPLAVDFSLRMVPEPPKRAESDDAAPVGARPRRQKKEDDGIAEVAASFELDEIDAEPFDGKTIDLDPIVREQVLLALPVTVVCREDCKGLCPTCGQNLNERDCGHGKVKEVDARLARLKEIKLKN